MIYIHEKVQIYCHDSIKFSTLENEKWLFAISNLKLLTNEVNHKQKWQEISYFTYIKQNNDYLYHDEVW